MSRARNAERGARNYPVSRQSFHCLHGLPVRSALRTPRSALTASWTALAFLLGACATIQEPPGGPPDLTPPSLVSVTPDSGVVVPGLKTPVLFRFSEVVSERPGAALDQMVLVSPRPRVLDVSWRRDAIAVKPREGWRTGVPYRVTLLPGIIDLRNNKMPTGKTVIFSAGAEIPATTLRGRVIDWEVGSAAPRALIEAVGLPDSLVYWDLTDSAGTFTMAAVPPGRYVVFATVDRNTNRRHDYREPFDSTIVTLDSSAQYTFWAFTHDSVGPRIRTLTRVDSLTIRIEFNQALRPQPAEPGDIVVAQLPDSTPVPVERVLGQAAYDSLQATERKAAAKPDSAAVVPARPGQPQPPRPPPPVTPRPAAPALPPGVAPGTPSAPAPQDSILLRLLRERPKLSATLVVRMSTPLQPKTRYVVRARVMNPTGAIGESTSVLVPPVAADTTRKAR
ncbi:MAG: Ig-like domain-containing protein [Gemmatimonadetes bacterium]|nr:Ig-like domain-containing protein [Gemmatimonadota bacterium]